MSQVKVSSKRHLAKTISYRIISTVIGFLIMWVISGSVKIGTAFGIAELIYKPIQYYIHERVWYRWIRYGLIKINPIKKEPIPPPLEPREIKGGEQPLINEMKRLTYSNKSDN